MPTPNEPFERHQRECDGEHWRPQDDDHAGGIMRPDEQRQAKPGQARGTHGVDGDDEVEPGKDRREAGNEDPDDGR